MQPFLKPQKNFVKPIRRVLSTLLSLSLIASPFTPFYNLSVEATQAQPLADEGNLSEIAPIFKNLEITHTKMVLHEESIATASLKIKNKTGANKNLEIKAIHLPAGLSRLDFSKDVLKATDLEHDKTAELSYRVLVPKGLQEGIFPVTYRIKVDDYEADYTSYFRFVKSDEESSVSDLGIRAVSIPERVQAGKAFDVKFYVANRGSATLENVNVNIELPAGFVNLSQNNFMISTLPVFSGAEFTVTLKASEEVEEKFHDLKINAIPSSSKANAQVVPVSIYTGTYVFGGKGGQKASGKVLLYLDSFKFTDEKGEETKVLTAGKNYNLDFRLKNTSVYALRNMKINFADSTGAITPNDSSASFYEPSVPAGGYVFETLPISVSTTATAGTLVPTIGVYFEYGADQSGESQEGFSVRINQQTKIETNVQVVPPSKSVMQGERIETNFNFINLGKTDLRNLRVYIKDTDVEKIIVDTPSAYIGNFSQGARSSADFSFSFVDTGMQKLMFMVEYEEPSGEIVVQEYPQEYEITEMVMPDPSDLPIAPMPVEEGPNLMPWLIGLLIIVIVATVLVLRNIKKKKKQQSLEMDD